MRVRIARETSLISAIMICWCGLAFASNEPNTFEIDTRIITKFGHLMAGDMAPVSIGDLCIGDTYSDLYIPADRSFNSVGESGDMFATAIRRETDIIVAIHLPADAFPRRTIKDGLAAMSLILKFEGNVQTKCTSSAALIPVGHIGIEGTKSINEDGQTNAVFPFLTRNGLGTSK